MSKGDALIQLVCFKLGQEDFGVDINKVQEINRMVEITKIPQSTVFVEGVINLRGKIIPIIDLRKRFNLKDIEEDNKETRIVVIESNNNTIGFIVDQVTEVLRIKANTIEPTPELVSSAVDTRFIEGVAQVDQSLLIVLNTDLIFSFDEHKKLAEVSYSTEEGESDE